MAVSRRHFLVAGQSLLAMAALPMKFFGTTHASHFGSSKTANLAALNMANFLPLVNSSFAVRSGSLTSAWFTLLSVEDMNTPAPAQNTPTGGARKSVKSQPPKVDTFALHFYGTGESLPQGTYDIEHHSLGRFALFVVPSGTSTYVAIISHLMNVAPATHPLPVNPKSRRGAPVILESL